MAPPQFEKIGTSKKSALNKRTLDKKSVSAHRNEAFDKKSISTSRKKLLPLLGTEKSEKKKKKIYKQFQEWCPPAEKSCE